MVRKKFMVPISLRNKSDNFVWEHSSSGEFSIKLATWIQSNNNQEVNRQKLLKKIWKLMKHPKVKNFARLLVHERLHTRMRLSKFIQNIDKLCPM